MTDNERYSSSFATDRRVQLVNHGTHARVYVTGVFCKPSQCLRGRRCHRPLRRHLVHDRKMEVRDCIDITFLAYADRLEDCCERTEGYQLQGVLRVELVSQRELRQGWTKTGVFGSDLGHGGLGV